MKCRSKRAGVVACVAWSWLACGCVSGLSGGEATALDKNASRPYPTEMAKEPSLPIQVLRDVTKIRLTNTSARSFGASTVWLNGRYSRAIEGLAIGETRTLDVGGFTDEFGSRFRGGGFFATVDPDPLVMAEIESGGKMYGLVVVGDLYE
jgi:hypothetical protein